MSHRYRCVLLFGPPGVGKGTQGNLIGKQNGYIHVASGDIFRALDTESPNGRKFMEYSSRGELVPDDLTVQLFLEHLDKMVAAGTINPATDTLLLDGIPRSLKQAEMLDGTVEPVALIHLVASDLDQMVARMKGRAEQQGRHDDADENVIRRRFVVFEEETAPVLDHYPKELVFDVDAIGTIEEVNARILGCLGGHRAATG